MSENKLIDSYVTRPFPWLSNSDISSYEFCCHSEYVNMFIRGYEEFETDARKMHFGADAHIVICNFYDAVDPDLLAKIPIELETKIENTRLFSYFMVVLHEIVEKIDPNIKKIKQWRQLLHNFAYVRTFDYRRIVQDCGGTSPKIVKAYFLPQRIEYYMEDRELQYHGKMDAQFNSTKPGSGTLYKITDWKSSKTPQEIIDGKNNVKTRHKRQVNGYAWLLGKELGTDHKIFEVSVEFFGGDGNPGAFCRKAHKRSIDALINNVRKLRRTINEFLHGIKTKNQAFPKKVSIYTCKNCSIRESCLTQVEMVEVYGNEGNDQLQGDDTNAQIAYNKENRAKVSPSYE